MPTDDPEWRSYVQAAFLDVEAAAEPAAMRPPKEAGAVEW
jgi:hypothetical protein